MVKIHHGQTFTSLTNHIFCSAKFRRDGNVNSRHQLWCYANSQSKAYRRWRTNLLKSQHRDHTVIKRKKQKGLNDKIGEKIKRTSVSLCNLDQSMCLACNYKSSVALQSCQAACSVLLSESTTTAVWSPWQRSWKRACSPPPKTAVTGREACIDNFLIRKHTQYCWWYDWESGGGFLIRCINENSL